MPKANGGGNPRKHHGGKREDLGGLYVRSAWEANYCRYLSWLIEQGEITPQTGEAIAKRLDLLAQDLLDPRDATSQLCDELRAEADRRILNHVTRQSANSMS